jgi:hypothetical protein
VIGARTAAGGALDALPHIAEMAALSPSFPRLICVSPLDNAY